MILLFHIHSSGYLLLFIYTHVFSIKSPTLDFCVHIRMYVYVSVDVCFGFLVRSLFRSFQFVGIKGVLRNAHIIQNKGPTKEKKTHEK